MYKADLAGNGHSLVVVGALVGIKVQSLVDGAELVRVIQLAADHYSRSALASLAVDGNNVLRILSEPVVDVPAAIQDLVQAGGVVIDEWVARDAVLKERNVIVSRGLDAKVVDLVVVRVISIQEGEDVRQLIPVDALHVRGWIAHGDDVGRDVGQIKVVLSILEAFLVLRYQTTQKGKGSLPAADRLDLILNFVFRNIFEALVVGTVDTICLGRDGDRLYSSLLRESTWKSFCRLLGVAGDYLTVGVIHLDEKEIEQKRLECREKRTESKVVDIR